MISLLVLVLGILAQRGTYVAGLPHDAATQPSEQRLERIAPGFYVPPSTFETFHDGIDVPCSIGNRTLEERAVTVLQEQLSVRDTEIAYISGYSSDVAEYAYLAQSYGGIRFINSVANLVFKDGKLTAYGTSFVETASMPSTLTTVDSRHAIEVAELSFQGEHNGHPLKTEYFVKEDGTPSLVHVIQIRNDSKPSWYEVYVDAHLAEVVGSSNFIAAAYYTAVPVTSNSVAQGVAWIMNPQDYRASPYGWHNKGTGESPWTGGNNVEVYLGRVYTPQTQRGPIFAYRYNGRFDPVWYTNPRAAAVNSFYVMNAVHDLAYHYGFTEKAFNFQYNNFGKGGKGGDPVLVYAQNQDGYNNALFGTPPDGQSGTATMQLWTRSNPRRDSDMDNDILVHEMTHGISNRMTGGGTARCLQSEESQGLGEGWSDSLADWTQQQRYSTVVDFAAAAYSGNNPRGIRKYVYSVNRRINPHKYSDVKLAKGPHAKGEIWATILHDVHASLVNRHGWDASAIKNPRSRQGNAVFLHLFFDSLAIQKCQPTFLDARNAWLQADRNRYRGLNVCLLWRAFASRGMGLAARGVPSYQDSFAVPRQCRGRASVEEV